MSLNIGRGWSVIHALFHPCRFDTYSTNHLTSMTRFQDENSVEKNARRTIRNNISLTLIAWRKIVRRLTITKKLGIKLVENILSWMSEVKAFESFIFLFPRDPQSSPRRNKHFLSSWYLQRITHSWLVSINRRCSLILLRNYPLFVLDWIAFHCDHMHLLV